MPESTASNTLDGVAAELDGEEMLVADGWKGALVELTQLRVARERELTQVLQKLERVSVNQVQEGTWKE